MFTARNYPYLAGSTLAGLTGYTDYDTLDKIQAAFVVFSRANVFETWADAWAVFWATSEFNTVEITLLT